MTKNRYLIVLSIFTLIFSAGMGGRWMHEKALKNRDADALRALAQTRLLEMKTLYEERAMLADSLHRGAPVGWKKRSDEFQLETQEQFDRFDFFQNQLTQDLSASLALKPTKKTGELIRELRKTEFELEKMRQEYHEAAFRLNDQISASERLPIFAAERMMSTATRF